MKCRSRYGCYTYAPGLSASSHQGHLGLANKLPVCICSSAGVSYILVGGATSYPPVGSMEQCLGGREDNRAVFIDDPRAANSVPPKIDPQIYSPNIIFTSPVLKRPPTHVSSSSCLFQSPFLGMSRSVFRSKTGHFTSTSRSHFLS